MIPKQVIEVVETKSQSKAAKATGTARTQARKARRSLAKIAAHPQHMAPMVKGKRPHEALLGARASAKLESEEARAYFDSLIVPESGSAQFPDLSEFPTIPVSSRYIIEPTAIKDSVTGNCVSVVALFPSLAYAYAQPSAVANTVLTWNPVIAKHPRYTSYTSNFSVYRTISMCAHVINSTNLNEKNGRLFQDLISEKTFSYSTSVISDLPADLTNISSSPTMKVGAFSNEYLEDVPRAGWVPRQLNALEFIPLDATTDNEIVIQAYPAIILYIDHQTTDLAKVQVANIEVFYNFEAVPLYTTAPLFNPTMCVGSPEKIASGLIENRDKLFQGVNATLKDFQRTVGTISEYSRATNEIWSTLSSLGAGVGYRSTARRNDSDLNRLVSFLRDFIPKDVDKQHSDRKEVEVFLDCLRTIRDTLNLPDFPNLLSSHASFRKVGPWKQELALVEVMGSEDDPDYVPLPVSSALKPLKTQKVS